jgi:hypothetical protein
MTGYEPMLDHTDYKAAYIRLRHDVLALAADVREVRRETELGESIREELLGWFARRLRELTKSQ